MSTTTISSFFDSLLSQAWDLLLYAWGEAFPVIIMLAIVSFLIGIAISVVFVGRRNRNN